MPLTKTQIMQLNDIYYSLQKAEDYLKKENVKVCKTNVTACKTDTYSNGTDTLTPMNKFIGSELNYLPNSLDKLFNFINLHS